MKVFDTYTCGHKGMIDVSGKKSEKDYRISVEFGGVCPECRKKNHSEYAKEHDFPPLRGSEKAILWAEERRISWHKWIKKELLPEYADKEESRQRLCKRVARRFGIQVHPDKLMDVLHGTLRHYLNTQRHAVDWINGHSLGFGEITDWIGDYFDHNQSKAAKAAEALEEAAEEQLSAENLLTPENKVYSDVVKITGDNKGIQAKYIYCPDFIPIVKSLSYKWTGTTWSRNLCQKTGKFIDRAAELANALLREGFTVSLPNAEAREKAIFGKFEPENKYWVVQLINDERHLYLDFPRDDRATYDIARRIPTAKWDKPYVRVDINAYEDIESFCDLEGFGITFAAKKLIDDYKATLAQAQVINPAEPDAPAEKTDKLKQILQSSAAILTDLKDDDE